VIRSIVRVSTMAVIVLALASCSDGTTATEPGGGETTGGMSTSTSTSTTATVSGAEYLNGVCEAVGGFQQDIEASSAEIQDAMTGAESPQDVVDALVTFLGDASDRAQQAADEIDALGTPAFEQGEEIRTAFRDALQQVAALFAETRDAIAGLDTSDPQALAEGLQEMSQDLQESGEAIQEAFAGLEDPEGLQPEDVPACEGLVGA
jgi:hypothetical protein